MSITATLQPKKIKFTTINRGLIKIKIDSGYETTGSFEIYYIYNSDPDPINNKYYIVKNGSLNSSQDTYENPEPLLSLCSITLFINGKYAPAPGHSEISVTYIFTQEDLTPPLNPTIPNIIELDRVSIDKQTDEPFERFTNIFTFEEN